MNILNGGEMVIAENAADALTARRMEALRLPVPDGIKLLRAALKGGDGDEA